MKWYGTATEIQDRKRSESLRAAEKRILEMIADDVGLSEILNDLCSAIDAHTPGASSFVCLMDPDGKQLWPTAGPRIPASLTAAISPFPIGPNRGSCGTAAFTKQRVIISDVSSDPKWPDEIRELALTHGVRAAWSEPLISKDGDVLGTFCLSYGEPRTPNTQDLELIGSAGNVARIAVERKRSQEALRSALDELRQITDAIPQCIIVLNASGRALYANRVALDYTGSRSPEDSYRCKRAPQCLSDIPTAAP
jgi:GAF domain-containing protein